MYGKRLGVDVPPVKSGRKKKRDPLSEDDDEISTQIKGGVCVVF